MLRRARLRAAVLTSLALLAGACSGSSGHTPTTSGPPHGAIPGIDPTAFGATVDNPWFPMPRDGRWTYVGQKGGSSIREVVTVLERTVTIGGVQCAVVSDDVYTKGALSEQTYDYYAQHVDGAVWYFGEDTETLDGQGKVTSREGSWRAGRDGARPGVVMPAHPKAGQTYEQEHYAGHAEDHARVVHTGAQLRVPAVSSRDVLVTDEWTPLEPTVRERKYYVRGYGLVKEEVTRGGHEVLSLASFKR